MDMAQKILIGLMLLISFKCFSATEPYVELLCADNGNKITVNYFRLVKEYDSQWRSLIAA
jgi:hypothetical protein